MGGSTDLHFRVRLAGSEIPVATAADLEQLARTGQIGPATEVWLPKRGTWVVAQRITQLAAHFERDPWAAWEAMEEAEDLEEASGPFVAPEIAPLPSGRGSPPPFHSPASSAGRTAPPPAPRTFERRRRDTEVEELPASAVSPVEPEGAPEQEQRGGKVIAFPLPLRSRTEGVHALATEAQVQPLRVPPRRPPPPPAAVPTFRWWLPVGALLAALLLVGLARLWVGSYAAADFQPTVNTAPLPPGSVEVAQPSDPPARTTPYAQIEEDLRTQMRGDIREVLDPGGLEDALLIELRSVRVDVASVEARITAWTGRKGDVPKTAELRVRVRSRGELDRELAGTGLIVGKYVQHYGLDVPLFEVWLDGAGGAGRLTRMDPEMARLFYLKRLDLGEYLEKMRLSDPTPPG